MMASGAVARELGVEREPQIRKIGRKRERARMYREVVERNNNKN